MTTWCRASWSIAQVLRPGARASPKNSDAHTYATSPTLHLHQDSETRVTLCPRAKGPSEEGEKTQPPKHLPAEDGYLVSEDTWW